MSILFVRHRNHNTTTAWLGTKPIASIAPNQGRYEIMLLDSAGATVRETQEAESLEAAQAKVIAYVVAQRLENA